MIFFLGKIHLMSKKFLLMIVVFVVVVFSKIIHGTITAALNTFSINITFDYFFVVVFLSKCVQTVHQQQRLSWQLLEMGKTRKHLSPLH